MKLIGLTRVRNEAHILKDTLDHWGQICDSIYVYDDASSDRSVKIAEAHPKVFPKHFGCFLWTPTPEREGQQREILFKFACDSERLTENDWLCYFDADERLEGVTRKDLERPISGIKVRLFDFYITPGDLEKPYHQRQLCGPEYRETLIFFRYSPSVHYRSGIVREPLGVQQPIVTQGFIRHYGKAISIEHWNAKCDFYAEHFAEPYKSKWKNRKHRAVHTQSDFGASLVNWSDVVSGKVAVGPCLYKSY